MPVVFRWNGYRLHFFSNEGEPREPPHIHVVKDGSDAKFWLFPAVEVAYNRGFTARELRQLQTIVEQRRDEIESAWNDYFA
jgi:uncharacterized protein DUF4160